MAKKRRKKRSKALSSEKFLRYLVWILAVIASLLVLFLVGYYFGYNNAKEDIVHELMQKEKERSIAMDKLKETIKQKESLNKKLEKILKKERRKKYDVTAAHEIEDKKVLKPVKKEKTFSTKYPKLAIIFDDVSFPSQVKAIKSLGFKVTMSFFPPSAIHPKTPQLAKKERFYMIHLPMEAIHFYKEEPFTLRAGDSETKIEERIAGIRQLFPRMRYINNHTGSKFTSDKKSVQRLVHVLDKYGIKFIDSRTASETKVPEVMRELKRPYLARDVFLDHEGDVASIKKQIDRAVKIARKYGQAIAIGHPHPNTIRALAQSKNLLKSVELVYVYQLR